MAAAVEIVGLTYGYPGLDAPAIRDVSLTVEPGEHIAVLGPNGAGKSTLLLHLNGLLRPTRGRVVIVGIEVAESTLREVRRHVGFVFQDPEDQLFLPTLLEDVAFGPLNEGRAPPEAEALARAQLAELGLEPAAHRAAHHLSGGEKRLASLATALVSRPALLVLDEPTAGLDARARSHVVELLAARRETRIVATHDLDVAAALSDRAIVLDNGEVVASRPTRTLLDDTGLLRRHGLIATLSGEAS